MCTVLQTWLSDMSKYQADVSEPGLKVISATRTQARKYLKYLPWSRADFAASMDLITAAAISC